jgi:hypothetical protein
MSELVGSVAAGRGEARLEVVLSERDGDPFVALQLSTWNEGLGWQVQKTIPLRVDQIGQFQRLLSQTRARLDERSETIGARAQVIPFAARGSVAPATAPLAQPARAQRDEVKTATS